MRDVLLVERIGYFGSAASGGPVTTLPVDRQRVFTAEIEKRLIECGGARTMPERPAFGSVWDPERLKWMELVMLEGPSRGRSLHLHRPQDAGPDAHFMTDKGASD